MTVASAQQGKAATDLLAGGGEQGERMRAFDWSRTPVGPVEGWPQSLITAVRIMLHSRYPMFVWWGRELIHFYNDAYIPVLGKRHPHALGQPASEVWAEVWGTVGPQTDIVLNEGRSTWNEELLLLMERYGYTEETYFTFSYSPTPDDEGGVGGIFCACTEDTRRVLGERRLRTLRDLGERSLAAKTVQQACHAAASALAGNPYDFPFALIYLLDEDGRQARLSEAIRLAPETQASPARVDAAGDGLWFFGRVVETGQSQLVENLEERLGRLPAGPWADDWTKTALALPLAKAGAQGLPTGFLVAGISPRLALDGEYRGFLELAAAQIATAIANARAYEDERKRAESLAELDRAKTAFFSNVSHEFRTPLTLMLGPLEDTLAESTDLAAADRERLEIAHRNSLRLLKLVNTLLDFSRIEAGRLQATYEPTDLAAFTADLASVFRSAIERAGLRLLVDCPPLGEPVYVDREMWEKIVLNLLSNAFKFTFEGEIEVALRRAGDRVVLSVRDTGTGIPEDELPHLFTRFHRVKDARGRTFEGSGIGLALVQELVKLHGGKVGVESEVDRGTRFTVAIPAGKAHLPTDQIGPGRALAPAGPWIEAHAEEALERAGEARPLQAPETRRCRILIADDNADMREYVRRRLEPQYEVELAADGLLALQTVRERAPDLVLADVMMPWLDGFELLRELRTDPRTATLPVVLLSARAGEEARVEGLNAGADDYLTKPFAARELLARVENSLKMAALRHQAAEREAVAEKVQGFLLEIAEKIRLADDAEALLGDVARTAGQRLGLARCAFDEIDLERGKARVHSEYHAPGLEPGPLEWAVSSFSPATLSEVKAGRTVAVSDARTDERTADHYETKYAPHGYAAYVTVPLTREGRWVASLWANKETPHAWTPQEVGLLETVAERTWLAVERLRSEAALRESERALREADRRKDEFLAMLAHELRNPLAPIRNAAQVLKLVGPADGKQKWAREVIERQTQHLTRLVDDLLDVSRITTGKVTLAREPLDLTTILHSAIEASRPLIDACRHQLTCELPLEPVRLEGDQTRLVQVVGNLLNNAAKYTDEGGQIRLQAAREGGEAVIRVRDNGMGLAADLLPHVFDLFTQADRSLDRSQGGLGIGLTLVRRLVELHGGRVEARSDGPGKGSEFSVRLPAVNPLDAAGDGEEAGESAPSASRGLRVLLVEDNVDSAEMMSFLLELRGHQVRTAHHGQEALEAARAFEPQAVLCDIGLPGMNGYEVAARLREQPAFQRTPFIALTGYGQDEARRRAREAGFDYHLVKPVEPDALEALLDSLRGS